MDNLRGAVLMTLAMLGFAGEDMFIKLMAGVLPTWQIIAVLGIGGASVFGALTLMRRQRLFTRAYLSGAILLRNLGELIGTVGFVTAIALTPLSSASAVLQATPLAVTLGAALFLREPVGWRRWSAILAGFVGVLLVIRPGLEGFEMNSLFAVQGVIGLAIRDLATRKVAAGVSSFQLSFLAFLTLIPAAGVLSLVSPRAPVAPDGYIWAMTAGAVLLGVLSYYAIVAAMRVGEVSFVTPFRYFRLLFALGVGIVVFDEHPDTLMLVGAAIIVGSGVYTVWRERRVWRERKHRPAA
ncbi:DMT family transporter [Antarcticimicrobium sediminis]|uniref:DMT family transporter n=1 Tax=Antarcticimicrobium sediminis TaxID=2546227 RepID=A0A4V2Z6N8_9RHOB|nr:DMT family transporter [Antarcticimicrobium sediminis]TDE33446.1 DMT family transporter [Antarcticimicrobium sediminis]